MEKSILKSTTEVADGGGGWLTLTATMENGDSGRISSKNRDYLTYLTNNVGKEFVYEKGQDKQGNAKLGKMKLSDDAKASSPKTYKSDYNSPERLALEKEKLEFEMTTKQDYISYAVAYEQANKFLAIKQAAGDRVTEKDLMGLADNIFNHIKTKVDESRTESKE